MTTKGVPEIGDLVDHGLDSSGQAPGKFRVTGWLCKAFPTSRVWYDGGVPGMYPCDDRAYVR